MNRPVTGLVGFTQVRPYAEVPAVKRSPFGGRDFLTNRAENTLPTKMIARDKEACITLHVVEARPKDAGRGIARLDPQDLERLGLKIGDVV